MKGGAVGQKASHQAGDATEPFVKKYWIAYLDWDIGKNDKNKASNGSTDNDSNQEHSDGVPLLRCLFSSAECESWSPIFGNQSSTEM